MYMPTSKTYIKWNILKLRNHNNGIMSLYKALRKTMHHTIATISLCWHGRFVVKCMVKMEEIDISWTAKDKVMILHACIRNDQWWSSEIKENVHGKSFLNNHGKCLINTILGQSGRADDNKPLYCVTQWNQGVNNL